MPNTKPKRLSFLAPKYWPTWFGLGLLRLCSILPYSLQMWLGRQLGALSYLLMPRRRHIVKTNIRLCFPELSTAKQQEYVKASFASVGMSVFEIGLSWWGAHSTLMKLHKPEGLEHLNAALAKNHGVIILASHFTTLEIAGTFLAKHTNLLNVVYKRAHNPLFERFIQKHRSKNNAKLVKHTRVRDMIRTLKKGEIIWYSPDQDFGEKDSVFAPFMGVSTCTLISTQRLSKITGAPVVPFYAERLANHSGYAFHFSPEIENFPTDNDIVDSTAINHAIEQQIKETPSQYLWGHRRFKSRPTGEADVYQK